MRLYTAAQEERKEVRRLPSAVPNVSGGEQVVRWTPLFHLEAQLKTLCEALQMEPHRGLLLRQTSYQNSSCQHRVLQNSSSSITVFPGTSCLGGGEGEDC